MLNLFINTYILQISTLYFKTKYVQKEDYTGSNACLWRFWRIKLIYHNGSVLKMCHIKAGLKALGLTALKEQVKENMLHKVILTAA